MRNNNNKKNKIGRPRENYKLNTSFEKAIELVVNKRYELEKGTNHKTNTQRTV